MTVVIKWVTRSIKETFTRPAKVLTRLLKSEDVKWTLKLYAFTLSIPIALSVVNILFCGILGLETRFGFFGNFKVIWIDYYFTGEFCHIDAWRWQLGILVSCYLFNIFEK